MRRWRVPDAETMWRRPLVVARVLLVASVVVIPVSAGMRSLPLAYAGGWLAMVSAVIYGRAWSAARPPEPEPGLHPPDTWCGMPDNPGPRAWADAVVAELDEFKVIVTGCLVTNGYERTCGHGVNSVRVNPGGAVKAGSVILRAGAVIRAFPEGGFEIGCCPQCEEAQAA